jgi:hypothetical protein
MGKQDPYCAARLGKEAKKTKTDKRGGQTPKWWVSSLNPPQAIPILTCTQGPRAPLHSARLARLPPPEDLRVQRRQEDGADWGDMGQP